MQYHSTQSIILGVHNYAGGYRPPPPKIEAVINIERPKDKKQVRQFLGMVQYYRDLWTKRSEILVLLTE